MKPSQAVPAPTPPLELDPGFSTPEMRRVFHLDARVRRMLEVEAALARAEAQAGVIPESAATCITAACRALDLDGRTLFEEGWRQGTPVLPLLARLREGLGEEAAPYLHFGATTQDIVDTALMLQMRQGLDLLQADVERIAGRCAELTRAHRATVMAGRTFLQHAEAITFGFKTAQWLDALSRHRQRLRRARASAVAQLGGPVGTLAALGEKGPEVLALLAQELDMAVPNIAWHTSRDRIGEVVTTLALVAGTLAKIAGDVASLAQTEVGEVVTRAGASSSLPTKRNPMDAIHAAAAARVALGAVPTVLAGLAQEHERGVGGWHGEWLSVPLVFHATAAAVAAVGRSLASLTVKPARMRANLRKTGARQELGSADVFIDRCLADFEADRG